ncbi:MAG: hypothetical protein HY749_16730 [Gammaproteobacteria bacterium]|nr:hypothetical protein [Gammaproteobacteria bacterium]
MQHRSRSGLYSFATAALLAGAGADAATLAASWNGGAGSYFDATRWSTSPLVPIDVGSTVFDVTIGGAGDSVTFSGGIASTVQSLTLGNGATFTVSGGLSVFTPGQPVFDSANLAVLDGGRFDGSAATSYTGASGTGAQRSLTASGIGSVLDLSGLTSVIRSNGFASQVRISAGAGARVDLSSLTGFTQPAGTSGGLVIVANGAGSVVDLPRLTALDRATLDVANGGTVNAQLQQFTNGTLHRGGAGTLDLAALTSAANSQITADAGATIDLGTATLDGASLVASGSGANASHVTSSITHYDGGSGTGVQRQLVAGGAGSTLDLGTLTSLVRVGGLVSRLTLAADDGGVVDLHSLGAFTANPAGAGTLVLRAAGPGSVIDLPLVTSLSTTSLSVSAGGTFTGPLQSFTDGTLTLNGAANIDLTGLATAAGSSIAAENGIALALGAVNLDRASLYARYGTNGSAAGVLSANITSYTGGSGTGLQRELAADGAGSLLDLHTLGVFTRVTGTVSSQRITASNGGRIDLGGLSAFTDPANGTGQLAITADGAGSAVALPNVTHFERASLTVANGGTIETPLERLIGGSLTKRNSGNIDVTGLVDGSESTFAAEEGAQLDLGSASIDGASLFARRNAATTAAGAHLVSAVTSYGGGSGTGHQRELRAEGADSVVDLSALTTLVRPAGISSKLTIAAAGGGRVALGALTNVQDAPADNGALALLADGAGSTLALSSLHALHDATLNVANGGRIDAVFTALVNATLTVDGASDIDLSSLADPSGTTFVAENGRHWDLGTLPLQAAGLVARKGATASFAPSSITTAATHYDGSSPAGIILRQLAADGAGSLLDLSVLQSVQRLAGTNSILQIQATAGGRVGLPQITGFDADSAHQSRVAILADGIGSVVDLPGLTSVIRGSLEMRNGGRVVTGALEALDNATLTLGDTTSNAQTFHTAPTLTLSNGATVDVAKHAAGAVISADHDASGEAGTLSVLADGTLAGNGVITGRLLNAGTLAPGASPGLITVNGDFVQQADGLLDFEFGGTPFAFGFDRLAVSGTASLDGTLDVTLTDPNPVYGTRVFSFLTAQGGLGGTLALGACAGCDGYTIALALGPNAATLTVSRPAPVPLPAAGWLVLAPLLAGVRSRCGGRRYRGAVR